MGSSCENSAFFPSKNPWNLEYVPGGSSGGSAAAVAADLAPLSLGTDTGGSIRQPAAFCGLVGAKPTYGRVSRYGVIAFGSSLDQVGPLARDIDDAQLCFSILAQHDARDSTSREQIWSKQSAEKCDLRGTKIAIIKNLSEEGNHPSVRKKFDEAVQFLKSNGAAVTFIDVTTLQYAMATYYVIAPSEASSNLSRYDGIRYGLRASGESLEELYQKTRSGGFGAEVKRRIMLGTFALSSGYYDAYFEKARLARQMMTREFEKFFETFDFMISPTTPTPAFKIGAKIEDPLAMYLNDICTISANLTGHPAVSLPVGFTEENLPIGIHVLGRLGRDETLFAFGKSFEEFFLLTMVCADAVPLLNPSIVSFTSKFLGSREQQLPPIVMQLFIEII